MTVSSGVVLNKKTLIASSSCALTFEHELEKGTEVWIHYKDDGSVLAVEPKDVVTVSP